MSKTKPEPLKGKKSIIGVYGTTNKPVYGYHEDRIKSAVEWLKHRLLFQEGSGKMTANITKFIDLLDEAFEDVMEKGEK